METNLALPDLQEPYAQALRECVEWLTAEYDVSGILVTGTVVRGEGDKRSDLDLHVLHRGDFRQRVQRWDNGVACEIFVNPPKRISQYFEEERASRRPMTAHMFATGHIAFDPTGFVLEFQCEAKDCLAHEPPAPTAEEIPRICYGPATELEDALDAFERDEPTGLFLLGGAVNSLVECRFQLEPGWLPRPKDRLKRLQVLDPLAARLAIEATVGGSAGLRVEAARELCRHVTGHEGFFEWESLRENA